MKILVPSSGEAMLADVIDVARLEALGWRRTAHVRPYALDSWYTLMLRSLAPGLRIVATIGAHAPNEGE